jgi:hypothetical protein
MSARARLAVLVAVCLLALGGTTAYVLVAREGQRQAAAAAPAQPTVSVASLRDEPRIVFRNTAIGPDYGKVAMVPLSDPGGPRAITEQTCDRVFATSARTLCLGSDGGAGATWRATVTTVGEASPRQLPLTGTPSRARLSRDGSHAATTTFVAGDSYTATGFSTRTVITALAGGASSDLEDFRLVHRGHAIRPADRNFWGVTFAADGDTFYVTASFDKQNWLARGSLSRRTLTTLHADAECPSLSPDGTRVAYKKRQDRRAGDWRIAVLDLASGRETVLPGGRSVDDQVEWLDDQQLVYGLPGEGTRAAETDVWVVPADGTGEPRVLVEKAWSPAVVR